MEKRGGLRPDGDEHGLNLQAQIVLALAMIGWVQDPSPLTTPIRSFNHPRMQVQATLQVQATTQAHPALQAQPNP